MSAGSPDAERHTMQYPINPKSVGGPMVRYRCPACGHKLDVPIAGRVSDDCDPYESALCTSCGQLHCVNAADGTVVAEDELGDPW
jgi:transcription elongation factor Elf1